MVIHLFLAVRPRPAVWGRVAALMVQCPLPGPCPGLQGRPRELPAPARSLQGHPKTRRGGVGKEEGGAYPVSPPRLPSCTSAVLLAARSLSSQLGTAMAAGPRHHGNEDTSGGHPEALPAAAAPARR